MAKAQETGASPRKGRRWLWRVVLVVILVILGSILVPHWRRATQVQPGEVAGVCRSISTAAITYYSTYQNGFPPTLWAFGPPAGGGEPDCNAPYMLDPHLADGLQYGYIFNYRPGPRIEDAPEGCEPGVESFTLSARPLRYRTGWRSYFTDETRVIRWTTEDRAATAEDPPL